MRTPTSPVGPAAQSVDPIVQRAIEDLLDDWRRAGGVLHRDDLTRLTSKRSLTAEQASALIVGLAAEGVDFEGVVSGDAASTHAGRTAAPLLEKLADHSVSSTSDAVRDYLRAIGRYRLLTAEDEVRLGRAIRAGIGATEVLDDAERCALLPASRRTALNRLGADGRSAHADLVRANLRLVVSIAKLKSYKDSGVEFLDRVQDGNIGLMRAADKFDCTLGYKFSTYATWWIRQAIERGIADRGATIRIPVHVHEKWAQVRRARRDLALLSGDAPTSTQIADALQWDVASVQAIIDCYHPVVSYDAPAGVDGDVTLGDLLSDKADVDGRGDPVDAVVSSARARAIDAVLTTLLPRSAEVIRRRYGLGSHFPETLEAIGTHLGLTRERVRQIEARSMTSLRTPARADMLRDFLYDDPDYRPGASTPDHERTKPATPAAEDTAAAPGLPLPTDSVIEPALNDSEAPPNPCAVSRDQFLNETIAEAVKRP